MSSRESSKMGDILATEANLLGMVKEVKTASKQDYYIEQAAYIHFKNHDIGFTLKESFVQFV